MIHARHPLVATVFLHHLEGAAVTPCLSEVREIAHGLVRVGFEPPSWRDVVAGARPSRNEVEEFEWGCGAGWQHEAGARVERHHRDLHIFPRLADLAKALVAIPRRAWEWSGFLHQSHVSDHPIGFPPLPPPLVASPSTPPLDIYGHHRAACARAGVLGRRGFALESVVARICREAGGRVSTNVLLRDLDLHAPIAADGRRLEVAVDGLPLFGGAQLAVDTTLVSALHCAEISRTCWTSCQISSGGSGC